MPTDNNRPGPPGQFFLRVELTPSGTYFPRTLNNYYLWVLPLLELTRPQLLRLIGVRVLYSWEGARSPRFNEGSHSHWPGDTMPDPPPSWPGPGADWGSALHMIQAMMKIERSEFVGAIWQLTF